MKVEDLINLNIKTTRGTINGQTLEGFVKDQSIDLKKDDVYSFGMLCIELLSRHLAFPSLKLREVQAQARRGKRAKLLSSCALDLAIC